MRVALIGYGAMGRLVADEARKAGDEIGVVITSEETTVDAGHLSEKLAGHDAVIDFSVAEVVLRNIEASVRAQVPIVEGATGWKSHEAEVRRVVEAGQGALVYGANFSIGVNVFYRVIKHAASLFATIEAYAPFIEEAHHNRKRDAPSGTALRIRDFMAEHYDAEIPTSSTRAGYIPGTHSVGFDSEADQVLLTHTARSRQGFASGALFAAHWIVGKKGVFEFGEVMDQVVK